MEVFDFEKSQTLHGFFVWERGWKQDKILASHLETRKKKRRGEFNYAYS